MKGGFSNILFISLIVYNVQDISDDSELRTHTILWFEVAVS